MDEPIQTRQLFGGAVEMAVPSRMADISEFRDIPDSQEVFSDANEDQSLIVEFVEHHDVPNGGAGQFFFEDLTASNAAAHASIASTAELRSDALPNLPPDTYATLVIGEQAVGKSRQGAEALNKIHVQILVVRLPEHGTDMLVTLNTPIYIHPSSAAAKEAGAGFKQGHEAAPALFRRMIATLRILDFGLFGGDMAEP